MSARVFIGTSGWHYDHWRGPFYPSKLPKTRWLEFYAGHFDTVEVNSSFYRLPSEAAVGGWRRGTPPGFTFSMKASRYITHLKRLKDSAEAVRRFTERVKILEGKLGPLLYQLPPNMKRDDRRLESFLAGLPPGYRHAVEFRHSSWYNEAVFAILRRYGIGLCLLDMPELRSPLVVTAGFAYIRFHGKDELYTGSYPDGELAGWADKLVSLAAGLEAVYIYFNNDYQAHAVDNARTLAGYLGVREKG